MAQPSQGPLTNPISVINPKFCFPSVVDLTIVKKVLTITNGNFAVTDANGNPMFESKGSLFTLHDKRIIYDMAGYPIVTLRQKILSAHKRWQVFRGDSSDSKDILFSAKKSSLIQLKTNLDVFLAANTDEEACDFKVKGSWFQKSCTIYLGDSSTVLAQMHKKHTVQSMLLGKDTFAVTVYPNVDSAFIVALVMILEAIEDLPGQKENKTDKENKVIKEAGNY
ncbi:LURP-one-like protein [Actinidia rufa]|uniref:LURP-one-like protein n=1 Tax=Actinidia rufa TaxID=165716 RepID=A0A7J0ECE1_9ERIC|nr:LURP-one-like protein [Actinidia rufa]